MLYNYSFNWQTSLIKNEWGKKIFKKAFLDCKMSEFFCIWKFGKYTYS